MNTVIPDGYKEDAMGRLIPVDQIKPIDDLRDDLVIKLVEEAERTAQAAKQFREDALRQIEQFAQMSAGEYGVELGGRKGNITLTSFSGEFKVVRALQDHITFDERLQAAKTLIDQCLNRWTEGSHANLKTIVTDAFQVDKQGKLNVQRILSLRKLEFDDETWKRAMQAISDAITITSSQTYVRFYRRAESGEYKLIPLDPNL